MSIHVCKCSHNDKEEHHLRYPGMGAEEAQAIADRINAGALWHPPRLLTNAVIEAAYWEFEARKKGYANWRECPQSERDAFKSVIRRLLAP